MLTRTWKIIWDFFLKETLAGTPDIFERARIRMTFTFCSFAIAFLLLLEITLVLSHLYISLAVALLATLSFVGCLYYIKYKKDYVLGAKAVIIIIFTGLTIDMLFSNTIALVDVLWFALLILFAFFTLDRVWGSVITILSIAISVTYVIFFFYDNFHKEEIFSAGQLGALIITIVAGNLLVFLFVKEEKDAQHEAGQKLKESISKLGGLNIKLEKLNSELKTSNRSLESYTYSVTHDLRAPLRAITNYSEILMKKFENTGGEEEETMEAIIKGAGKMNELINDLLNFSRSGSKELGIEEIDMDPLVKEVISDYEKNEGKDHLTVRVTPLSRVKGDRALLKQVLYNLFSNAVKYSSKKEKPLIEIGSKTADKEQVFFVKDNGIGFDMKFADKLFSIFQRFHSEEEFKGTGIGLAIVKQIVNRHGGRVWAESKPDMGSTFYFSLPQN